MLIKLTSFLIKKDSSKLRYFFSRIPPPEGCEALCLPNLLAGGLPAGLALAADKRAQHTRATQKSTTHARHTKRDTRAPHKERRMDAYTGDITAAIEMGGRPRSGRPPSLWLLSYQAPVYTSMHLFLCGARVLCSFVWRTCVVLCCPLQAPNRAAHLQASPQPRD